MLRLRKCLLTGANGFIALNLARSLRKDGVEVVGLDIHRCNDASYAKCHQVDITGPIGAELFENVDAVFHLAGKVHALAEIQADELEYSRVNTEGTRHVLEAAKAAEVKRFVFFSTVKAMSGKDEEVQETAFSELSGIQPGTPYGWSKLKAEELVLRGGYVPEPVVLRLCMVYGAGAKGNILKMLRAVQRRCFPPVPELGNRRSMVHVSDVVQAAILVGTRPEAVGEVFIVSDGKAYSTRQIYESMCRGLGRKVVPVSVPLWVLRALACISHHKTRMGCHDRFVEVKTSAARRFWDSASLHPAGPSFPSPKPPNLGRF